MGAQKRGILPPSRPTPLLCPERGCGPGSPALVALTGGCSSALCRQGFKGNLRENRRNSPRDIFLLGMSPAKPHTSPRLGPREGARGCPQSPCPSEVALGSAARTRLLPRSPPSLVWAPHARAAGSTLPQEGIVLWMFPVTSHTPQGLQDVHTRAIKKNQKSDTKMNLTPSANAVWRKEHHLSSLMSFCR